MKQVYGVVVLAVALCVAAGSTQAALGPELWSGTEINNGTGGVAGYGIARVLDPGRGGRCPPT